MCTPYGIEGSRKLYEKHLKQGPAKTKTSVSVSAILLIIKKSCLTWFIESLCSSSGLVEYSESSIHLLNFKVYFLQKAGRFCRRKERLL